MRSCARSKRHRVRAESTRHTGKVDAHAQGARRDGCHRLRRLGDWRPRPRLHRPRQRQPSQPCPISALGSNQPLWRTVASVRMTPAISARSTSVCLFATAQIDWDGARGGDARHDALPRRRDRDQPVSRSQRCAKGAGQPAHRPRHDGLGRDALRAGHPLRQRRGGGARREGHGRHPGLVNRRIGEAGRGARRLPQLGAQHLQATARSYATPPARPSRRPAPSASWPTARPASSRSSRWPSSIASSSPMARIACSTSSTPSSQRALEASDIIEKDEALAYVKEHGSLHGHPAAEHPALRPT